MNREVFDDGFRYCKRAMKRDLATEKNAPNRNSH